MNLAEIQPCEPVAVTLSGWVFFDSGYSCRLSDWEDYQDGNLSASDVKLITPLGPTELVGALAKLLTGDDKRLSDMHRHWPVIASLDLGGDRGTERGPDVRSLEKARNIGMQALQKEQAKTDAARIDAANAPVHDDRKHRGGFYDA